MVVEEREDLDIAAVDETDVRKVSLPALIGLLRFEADVGRARSLLWLGLDKAQSREVPADGCGRDRDGVVMRKVPGDGAGACVETLTKKLGSQAHDPVDYL